VRLSVDASIEINQQSTSTMNRIERYFRDPTLEEPRTDYYVVRTPWDGFIVSREVAARILAAVGGYDAPKVIRCQTVTGSVVYLRTNTIVSVQECTRAQRDTERRFWKEIDDEDSSIE
jgi:hypothetical protein